MAESRSVWVNSALVAARNKKQRLQAETRDPYQLARWIPIAAGLVGLVSALASGGFFFGSWYMKSGLEVKIGLLDNKLEMLNTRLETAGVFNKEYRKLAAAKGFKTAEIIPVNFVHPPPKDQRPKFELSGSTNKGVVYRITYELTEITSEYLSFNFSGVYGTNEFKDNIIQLPLELGNPVRVDQMRLEDVPPLYVEVIYFPSKEVAIVAVGQKSTATT